MRRLLALVTGLAAIAGAVFAATHWLRRGEARETNGGRERTEELRREIEASRERLRESIRSQDG